MLFFSFINLVRPVSDQVLVSPDDINTDREITSKKSVVIWFPKFSPLVL